MPANSVLGSYNMRWYRPGAAYGGLRAPCSQDAGGQPVEDAYSLCRRATDFSYLPRTWISQSIQRMAARTVHRAWNNNKFPASCSSRKFTLTRGGNRLTLTAPTSIPAQTSPGCGNGRAPDVPQSGTTQIHGHTRRPGRCTRCAVRTLPITSGLVSKHTPWAMRAQVAIAFGRKSLTRRRRGNV